MWCLKGGLESKGLVGSADGEVRVGLLVLGWRRAEIVFVDGFSAG